MVRGQQHSGWLKNRRQEPAAPKTLFKILTATELLQEKKYQPLLSELPKLSGLGEQEYNTYFLKTIYNFAEFAQLLPHTLISYFSYPGGFLDHGLERCYRALKLCRTYFTTVENAQENSLTRQQLLWIYAIFSASLLLDVGKLCAKIRVTLCNAKGGAIQDWQPFSGSMTQHKPATHYQYEFIAENLRRLRNLTTSLLARQLMPAAGFNWIASDKAILEAWLAIMNEDHTGGTIMPIIIPIADAQAIDSYWAMQQLSQKAAQSGESLPQFFVPGSDAFAVNPLNASPTELSNMKLDAAEAFLNWLKNGVEKGKISINKSDSWLHRVADGRLVILPQAFGEFAKQNQQYKDPAEVAKQFNMLEITGEAASFRQFKEAETKIVKGAFVLNNPFMIISSNTDLPQASQHLERIGITTSQAIQNWFKPSAAPAIVVEPPKAVK